MKKQISQTNIRQQHEMEIQDGVAKNYEHLRYHLLYARTFHDWAFKEIASWADPKNISGWILDDGCGVGQLANYLPEATLLCGLDLSYEMLRKASVRMLNLIQGSSTNMPITSEVFDLIFANSLVHHLPDPEQGISEIHRILKPGGQVILIDTNRSLVNAIPRAIAYRRDNFSMDHVNFKSKTYVRMIANHFKIDRIEHWGYLAYPFGFPDMMGPFRKINFPPRLVRGLIAADKVISNIPLLRTQSWWIAVSAHKEKA
jgi:SAM-dependent methyltransferase